MKKRPLRSDQSRLIRKWISLNAEINIPNTTQENLFNPQILICTFFHSWINFGLFFLNPTWGHIYSPIFSHILIGHFINFFKSDRAYFLDSELNFTTVINVHKLTFRFLNWNKRIDICNSIQKLFRKF